MGVSERVKVGWWSKGTAQRPSSHVSQAYQHSEKFKMLAIYHKSNP
jgi:hypothetical protein